ncbi:EIIABC-Fru [Sebaldella termitidis]|jgi:PTS system fructose-specific IIC component|uniref:PTS system, fructose subfamily, IIC subunit n=1 Tax=Sebaldella termitidis (strain ATCC 33386 / NCTC 11300) TaxID=526218 RepID=D1ARV6_SEBTE|nr:fructose-specific PTS transporter subunit EIIC [Sebaldella termitidis]ACZ10592.1 PTS system, fructose subfamily, IIC subunit [Sebaldella termitidis ATCC 33386]MBP7979481.1 PTS sugar transporter subunit IIA [Sebaldella sp.]SUI25934.1 EIIABC-Fru [Sebaldella termitidis]
MKITELLIKERMNLDLQSVTKEDVINELAEMFLSTGIIDDLEGFMGEIKNREALSSTALEEGIAIPHAKTKYVKKPALAFGRSKKGIDYESLDGEPSTIFFMIAAPEDANNAHIETLARLTQMLLDTDFRTNILEMGTKEEILDLINKKESAKLEENAEADNSSDNFIIAATACPTGIAHTYMAEEALKKAAAELGVPIKVETNGTDGVKHKLTAEDIEKAKGVILAIDRGIETDRFSGKKVIQTGTKEAIRDAKGLIQRAVAGDMPVFAGSGETSSGGKGASKEKTGIYKHLMTGVSFMLPFVVSGGILIALAFLFDKLAGVQGAADAAGSSALGSTTYIAKLFMDIGGAAFGLFIPILGAYIAYSIGERPALTAGFVGGALAVSGGSGFLGAMLAGFLAGYVTKLVIASLKGLPKSLNGIKAILLYPLLTVLLTGVLMIIILNPPVRFINESLVHWLQTMGGTSRILLGIILGGMMAVDMGGPVNKAAYVFATGTLATAAAGEYGTPIMAAVMAGGMVPPLGIALATTIFKNKFNTEEREAGKTNYIMGLSFITEGAIPFAAGDPLRVLPASIAGSAVAGAISMFFNISIPAPHGGLVVAFLSNNAWVYLLAILIGAVITAVILGLLKKKVN